MYVDGHNRIKTAVVEPETDHITVLGVCGGCHLQAWARFDMRRHHVRITGDALDIECYHRTVTRRAITRRP
jgi:hypothetical protein